MRAQKTLFVQSAEKIKTIRAKRNEILLSFRTNRGQFFSFLRKVLRKLLRVHFNSLVLARAAQRKFEFACLVCAAKKIFCFFCVLGARSVEKILLLHVWRDQHGENFAFACLA